MKHRTLFVAIALAGSLLVTGVNAGSLTRDNGALVGDNQNSQTAGAAGPVLLQDVHLIQKLQRFDRERIPERVVHARGTGAYGVFTATETLGDITQASLFTAGKQTPVFVRFSSVVHGNHSPETLRDPRGFATKFYTEQGNWDLVGNNFPTFFIRDAIKFPDMVHAFKPDPDKNYGTNRTLFDFFQHVPEATRTLTLLFSNEGTPASYREMDGSSVHAYKLVSADGQYRYVKFSWKSQQGVRNHDPKQAAMVQGQDFNHMSRDLVEAINAGQYPKWDLYLQVLEADQLARFEFDPLDATKIWPEELVPARRIGTMELNRNPANIFQETEQVAMAPANLIPGIEPSEDRLLQGRLFSYSDTQMYRLGANHQQLPVNRPRVEVNSNNQDGAMNVGARTGEVNYEPSMLTPRPQVAGARYSNLPLQGVTEQRRIAREQNFKQAGELFRSFDRKKQQDLIQTLGAALAEATPAARQTMLAYFYKADAAYGEGLARVAKGDLAQVRAQAGKLAD